MIMAQALGASSAIVHHTIKASVAQMTTGGDPIASEALSIAKAARWRAHALQRRPALRIGYVSADFGEPNVLPLMQ